MNRPSGIIRRALTVLLALSPLVAGADLCTVGALTGRAELACAMESGGRVCGVAPSAAPSCSHCAPAAPVRETPRSHGPTCCELRPQAETVSVQPALTASPSIAHLAVASAVVTPGVATARPFRVAQDDGRAPPGDVPALRAPRGPPLR
jgi:hypothetical protein